MKCGHCKGNHDKVAEVLECSKVKLITNTTDSGEVEQNRWKRDEARAAKKSSNLSEKQQGFLRDLLRQFNLALEDDLTPETISYDKGKPILNGLVDARRNKATGKPYKFPDGVLQSANPNKSKTRTSAQRVPLPDVPAGYYSVPDWTGNEELKFFRVKRPTEGDWAGRTFVDHIVGGHPGMKCHGDFMRKALEAILEFGPEDAGILYGIKIKQCCSCNLKLTKKASRALSRGRHCAYKHGQGEEWDALNADFNNEDANDDEEAGA